MDIRNEDGVLSIEASLVLPIYILILLSFLYLITFMEINDTVLLNTTNEIIRIENDTYKKYKLLENEILLNEKIRDDNKYSKRMKKYEIDNYISEDLFRINIKYNFSFPINYINDISIDKDIEIKSFTCGKSIKEYGLVSEYIKTDYDVWLLGNMSRAKEINNLMDGFDNFDGSKIDKIYNGYLVSIVSLDYRKESYQNDDAILNKLKSDVNYLINFKEGNINGEYVGTGEYHGKIFNLILPSDEFDTNIKNQLMIVKTYCNNNNIQFKTTIIE